MLIRLLPEELLKKVVHMFPRQLMKDHRRSLKIPLIDMTVIKTLHQKWNPFKVQEEEKIKTRKKEIIKWILVFRVM